MGNSTMHICENCGLEYDVSKFPLAMCEECSKKYAKYWMAKVYRNLYGNVNYDRIKHEQMKGLIDLIPIRPVKEDPYPVIKEQTRSCKDCNKNYLANNDWPYEICIECALKKRDRMSAIIEDEFSYGKFGIVNPIIANSPRIWLDRIKDGDVKNSMTKEDAARIQSHCDKNDGVDEGFKRRAQAAGERNEQNP